MTEKEKEMHAKRVSKYISSKCDRLGLTLPAGTKEQWQQYAAARGLSLTAYISQLIAADNSK